MLTDIFANRRKNIFLFLAFIAALTIGSMVLTQFDPFGGLVSILKAFFWGVSNFYPDGQSLSHIGDILVKLRDTILMSIASSVAAAVFAMGISVNGIPQHTYPCFLYICLTRHRIFLQECPARSLGHGADAKRSARVP